MPIDFTQVPPERAEEILINQIGYEQIAKLPHKRGDTRLISWVRPESMLDGDILSVRFMARSGYEESMHLALDETVNSNCFQRTDEGGQLIIDHPESPIGGTTLYTSTEGQKKRSLFYAIEIQATNGRFTVKSGKLVVEADIVHDIVFGDEIASVIDGLPRNIIEALLGADDPSAANVFATVDQLQNIGAISQNWRVERHDLTQDALDNGFTLLSVPDLTSPILMFVRGATFHGYSDEFSLDLDETRVDFGSLKSSLIIGDVVVMSYYSTGATA